ncbi:MAG: prepilin-type N-terminal cleavage/methylation domain-containing protein [Myxococcales bacterium]|nr:prepilin-type N-terminal cleavage/methylation domain-containing protein [Myxococcales bacterium]MCB9521662.1 prepilin-type N-terminal cleavage/methylation domain-containing protein [Myxococcales bacterium]
MKTSIDSLRNRRGFTLLELMIAVAIIAILAAVAVVSLRYQGFKAKIQQAHAFLGAVAANEAGKTPYVGLSSPAYCPASVGATQTSWDTACQAAMWNRLGISVPRQSYFQYTVIAGGASDDCATLTGDSIFCGTWTSGDRWWVAIGRGDLDGDGALSTFITSYSMGGEVIEIDPME